MSLIITDAVGWIAPIFCAVHFVNAVVSVEVVALVGDDTAVAVTAAIATATAQVEPSTSSLLPILRSSAVGVPMVPVSPVGATDVGRTLAVVGSISHRRSCTWLSLPLVRREFFEPPALGPIHHLPALCYACLTALARTLLMAQARSMWRDSLSRGAQRRTPTLLPRRRLGLRSRLHPYVGRYEDFHMHTYMWSP